MSRCRCVFSKRSSLACLHRLVLALHVVFVEIGACGIRLVCLLLEMTGLYRFVGASFGTQQQVSRNVEKAMVAYTYEETGRLAQDMPPQEITVTQDEIFTGRHQPDHFSRLLALHVGQLSLPGVGWGTPLTFG